MPSRQENLLAFFEVLGLSDTEQEQLMVGLKAAFLVIVSNKISRHLSADEVDILNKRLEKSENNLEEASGGGSWEKLTRETWTEVIPRLVDAMLAEVDSEKRSKAMPLAKMLKRPMKKV